ncbi:MAG TPA: hypothetical protein VGP15_07305 [Burkholderiales bacterium]|jgi:hypothetical protein|nr:hypothetical protein [Burkholderiales bacterium]
MHRIRIAAFLVIAASGGAHAHEANDPAAAAAESFLQGLVQEEDVGLLFGYLREALAAAAEGRELPPSGKLTQRAEAIGDEAKRRGVIAGGVLLDALELSIREIFRTPPRLHSMAPPASGTRERIAY